jgi:DNA-binding MarR family transcriptional regulator
MAAVHKLLERLADAGHPEIREGYGCVFGFIDMDNGSRLTELAERSGLTKQAVGEAVSELERIGYLTRVPDPTDRRAKLIKLTERGVDGCLTGRRLFAEIEAEWAEQIGAELMASLREAATRIAELEGAPVEAAGSRRAA